MNVTTCSHRPIIEPCNLPGKDYQIDPYIGCGHNCFYCYALNTAETDWAEEIKIHENISEQLVNELNNITTKSIYLGYKTDPYQPLEEEHRQTHQVLELLLDKGISAHILTKSNLMLRDIDLLKQMDEPSIGISVAFNDDTTRRIFEGNTIDTELRIEALRKCKEAGIRTYSLVCPVIPYVTDPIPLIHELSPITEKIWIYGLSFLNRDEINWKNVESILNQYYPDKKAQIEEILFDKEHTFWKDLKQQLSTLHSEQNLNLDIHV